MVRVFASLFLKLAFGGAVNFESHVNEQIRRDRRYFLVDLLSLFLAPLVAISFYIFFDPLTSSGNNSALLHTSDRQMVFAKLECVRKDSVDG